MQTKDLAQKIVKQLKNKGLHLATVESCTGGGLANAITNISGASEVFSDGFVTYSNQAKLALGVSKDILETYTVYSVQTAEAMARAGMGRAATKPDVAIGITGSLSRTDPNNPDASVVGEIHAAIVWHDGQATPLTFNVPVSLSRPQAKQFIVARILTKLLETVDGKKPKK